MPPSYGPSTSYSASNEALAEIRDTKRLFHLRLRPRNMDGSLDLRAKVNKGFTKYDNISDYYSPQSPSLNISKT